MKALAAGLALLCGLCLPPALRAGELVDLNTVTEERLLDLPTGLSDEQVRALIRHRDQRSGFASPEDVREVPGLDDENFRQLYPFELNGKVMVEVEIPKGVSPY